MKYIAIVISLYLTPCFALELSPPIEKAKEAFLIQSGAEAQINLVKNYARQKGKYYLNYLGLEKPSKLAFGIYNVCQTKRISYDNITFDFNSSYYLSLSLKFN